MESLKNAFAWGTGYSSQPSGLCEVCGVRPKFVEGAVTHPYCSRTCARNGGGAKPTACLLRGCRATGKTAFHNFCSEAHARDGVRFGLIEGCEVCKVQPRSVGRTCIACGRAQRTGGTQLRELNPNGALIKKLKSQFATEWQKGSSRNTPQLVKVYEVLLPQDVKNRHDQYRNTNIGHERVRSYHSSQCICDMGVNGAVLCDYQSCGICSVVKSSFKTSAFGVKSNNGRFGDGIYSYRNPALADKFATSCTSSPYRVTIVCDAIVEAGQSQSPEFADKSLFVLRPEAILPTYIFMYAV